MRGTCGTRLIPTPAITSRMGYGTFNLRGGDTRLRGNLHMDSDISHVTTGKKAWLLKPIAPLFHPRTLSRQLTPEQAFLSLQSPPQCCFWGLTPRPSLRARTGQNLEKRPSQKCTPRPDTFRHLDAF